MTKTKNQYMNKGGFHGNGREAALIKLFKTVRYAFMNNNPGHINAYYLSIYLIINRKYGVRFGLSG